MEKIYDLIIIGSGPAGLSAAIYAKRAGLCFIVIEANYMSGGQVVNTSDVDNYLGFHEINGFELAMKFRSHADMLGTEFVNDKVIAIEGGSIKKLTGNKASYYAKSVIIATGAISMKLGCEGEELLKGKGVSYCATCDGNFFKNKEVAVIGGGDTALEDAIYLARICKTVHIIHRRDSFRGAKSLEAKVNSFENVTIHWNRVVKAIEGDGIVENIILTDTLEGKEETLYVNGVFIAIGTKPETKWLDGVCDMDSQGYIIADENCVTNLEGVFVAGDIRKKALRQISTAVADGANAVNSAIIYINGV